MTEANFSFTTKVGNDLFTVRGNNYDEFLTNLMSAGQVSGVGVLIGALNGEMTPLVEQQAAANVAASLGATVVTPAAADPFAPIPPAAGASAGDRTCSHGVMVKRTGVGQKGEWRAWFCPTPKDTPGQCKPVFADKRNPAEWGSF